MCVSRGSRTRLPPSNDLPASLPKDQIQKLTSGEENRGKTDLICQLRPRKGVVPSEHSRLARWEDRLCTSRYVRVGQGRRLERERIFIYATRSSTMPSVSPHNCSYTSPPCMDSLRPNMPPISVSYIRCTRSEC